MIIDQDIITTVFCLISIEKGTTTLQGVSKFKKKNTKQKTSHIRKTIALFVANDIIRF